MEYSTAKVPHLDAIDFGLIGLAVLTLIISTIFIIVIWTAALGMPVV